MNLPSSFNNKLTKLGLLISVVSFVVIFILLLYPGSVAEWSVAGILFFVAFVIFWLIGIILIPVGIKKAEGKKFIFFNLQNKTYKNAFGIILSVVVLFVIVLTVGAYKSYHYMESVKFCGTTCHVTMEPEYVAHEHTAHADVKCVDCHVGEGISGYLASKVEASKELIAIVTGTVPHPIHANEEIHEVAKEACLHCHWSQKFWDDKNVHKAHFLSDEENTEWDIDLTLHMASGNEATGLSKGIHWHMNKDVKIEYVATDKEKQNIPWIRYTNLKTGKSIVYQNQDEPLDSSAFDTLEVTQMTCLDCHSRPAHNFQPPENFINAAFVRNEIDRSIPEFKSAALAAVKEEEYTSSDSAKMLIPQEIKNFYKENYPEILTEKKEELNNSIAAVMKGFSQNIFPDMKVRWDKYYDNIGHMYTNGCFRCHDDNHISATEKVIPKDCSTCHSIKAQGEPGNIAYANPGGELKFVHPGGDVTEEDWSEGLCSDCHGGN